MAIVQDVQEGQRGVLADGLLRARVDQVPRAAHVCVRHVERGVQWLERAEGDVAARVGVGGVDLAVFAFVGWAHVPVEAIFEARRVVVREIRALELWFAAGEGAGGLHEVGFGGGDEPVGEGAGHGGVFLESRRGG